MAARKGENWCGPLSGIVRCCGSCTIHAYAGAFVFGRHHSRKTVDGNCRIVTVPQQEWQTLIPGAHAGYVSWEDYQHNQERLHESAQAMGGDRRRSPAREGPALLQG